MLTQKPCITTNSLCYKGTLRGHDDKDDGDDDDKSLGTASEQIDTPCSSWHHLFCIESIKQVPKEVELRTREEIFVSD